MSIPILRPARRAELRAEAHALSPVVMIGDAGLSEAVLGEIDRALTAHALIKIRVLGDDRSERLTLLETICTRLLAAPVQQIGKLLIVYRPKPEAPAAALTRPAARGRGTKRASGADKPDHGLKRNPVSGRLMAERAPRKGAKAAASTSPPRTARVRKAGVKSAKKPFQAR
jgi:putative YhbY family RNA-binding protein